jgi:hypothetical protein
MIKLYALTACAAIVRHVDSIMTACVVCALAYPNIGSTMFDLESIKLQAPTAEYNTQAC